MDLKPGSIPYVGRQTEQRANMPPQESQITWFKANVLSADTAASTGLTHPLVLPHDWLLLWRVGRVTERIGSDG